MNNLHQLPSYIVDGGSLEVTAATTANLTAAIYEVADRARVLAEEIWSNRSGGPSSFEFYDRATSEAGEIYDATRRLTAFLAFLQPAEESSLQHVLEAAGRLEEELDSCLAALGVTRAGGLSHRHVFNLRGYVTNSRNGAREFADQTRGLSRTYESEAECKRAMERFRAGVSLAPDQRIA